MALKALFLLRNGFTCQTCWKAAKLRWVAAGLFIVADNDRLVSDAVGHGIQPARWWKRASGLFVVRRLASKIPTAAAGAAALPAVGSVFAAT